MMSMKILQENGFTVIINNKKALVLSSAFLYNKIVEVDVNLMDLLVKDCKEDLKLFTNRVIDLAVDDFNNGCKPRTGKQIILYLSKQFGIKYRNLHTEAAKRMYTMTQDTLKFGSEENNG